MNKLGNCMNRNTHQTFLVQTFIEYTSTLYGYTHAVFLTARPVGSSGKARDGGFSSCCPGNYDDSKTRRRKNDSLEMEWRWQEKRIRQGSCLVVVLVVIDWHHPTKLKYNPWWQRILRKKLRFWRQGSSSSKLRDRLTERGRTRRRKDNQKTELRC